MNRRKWITGLVVVALAFLGYQCANGVMVAKAVLPPHATRSQIVRSLLKPPYEMATPHRSLLKALRSSLFPVTTVCASLVCDGTEAKPTCNSACGFCGYCPDCVKGPCTLYVCKDTGASWKLCVPRIQGPGNCFGCENDRNVDCN